METIPQSYYQSRLPSQAFRRPRLLSFFLFSGWAVTLLYFPSGLLHYWLGAGVYARDVLLALHLAATLAWLGITGHWPRLIRGTWLLFIPLLLLVPGLRQDVVPRSDAFIKWFFQWFDAILIGYLLALRGTRGFTIRAFCLLTLGILAADYAAGFYEWRTDSYVIPAKWNDRTALGVIVAFQDTLGGHIRVRGLQRDVFCFANMMAMGCVSALSVICAARRIPWLRICGIAGVPAFAWMLFVSGGRSSFAGIIAAGVLAACLFVRPDLSRPALNRCVVALLGLALFLTCYGIGNITEAISSALLANTHIGDSQSAFMRDEGWQDIFGKIGRYPWIAFAGAPVASLFNGSIESVIDVVDNQFIWSLYHLGIVGCAALAAFFYRHLNMWVSGPARIAHLILVLFFLEFIGDGIARESLFFFCSIPAFIACGFLSGSLAAPILSESR